MTQDSLGPALGTGTNLQGTSSLRTRVEEWGPGTGKEEERRLSGVQKGVWERMHKHGMYWRREEQLLFFKFWTGTDLQEKHSEALT